jgi:hypothetical protein
MDEIAESMENIEDDEYENARIFSNSIYNNRQ